MTTATTTTTRSLTVVRMGDVDLTFTERGGGRPFVILHGGAGPLSVSGFADLLAETEKVRVIAPTYPGFGGTPRLGALDSIRGLAALYVALLDDLELTDVTVIGNSIGGWIAAEMALRGSPRVDRIVDPDYGRSYAAAIPTARFQLLNRTGHVTQIETPHLLLSAVTAFAGPGAIPLSATGEDSGIP